MKIGLISSSPVNLYASTLIAKLSAQGDDVDCVICVEKPKVQLLRNYIKRVGYRRAATRILDYFSIRESKANEVRRRLREFARDQDIDGWNRPLPALCAALRIALRRVRSINHPSAIEFLKSRDLGLLLNAGGEIIRKPVLESVSVGVLNSHMAYLPTFRGYNVLEWSLFFRHRVGVTLHFIDAGIDTGDVIGFREIPVEEADTVESLRAKAYPASVALMAEYIARFARGTVERRAQRPGDGKQYFAMHPRLAVIAGRNIARLANVRGH